VQEADSNMVAGCSYLGEVSGTSGWGGLAASTGIENAKNQALEQAARKRATHVVWNTLAGGMSPSVSGKAYRCPSGPPEQPKQ
jgi:D-serine dehydratase